MGLNMNQKEIIKRWLSLFLIGIFVISFLPNEIAFENNNNDNNNLDTEYWCLLVPVAIYADDPDQNRPLMFSEVDDFYDLLLESSMYNEDHIKMIRGEDATVANIFKGFQWLDEQEDESDRCVVYLTTHGFPIGYDLPPFDEEDGTDEALMSYWGFAYPNSCIITDDEINFWLNRLESEGVCLIVDSCYAGGFNDPPNWNKASTQSISNDEWMREFAEELKSQGRVVLMASCEDEVSYSGGFAPYVIDAMKGYADSNQDGIVSAEEVFIYAETRTVRQRPTIYDNYPGEFPLITVASTEPNDIQKTSSFQQEINNDCVQMNLIENATVQGFITDLETGASIEGATVELRKGNYGDSQRFFTQTDTSGFFHFSVEPGPMRVSAEKIGYFLNRTDFFTSNEGETVWINLTLEKHPAEYARVCGFLKEIDTNEPVSDVEITIEWGDRWERYWNKTFSDETGFYSINIAGGEIELQYRHEDYLPKETNEIVIGDYETLWLNNTLKQRPDENALICGYVTNAVTMEPVNNAFIELEWMDTEGNRLDYETSSDSNGYYSCQVPAGEIYIDIRATDFYEDDLGRNDVYENETRYVNISLDPDIPQVSMIKPLNAIYMNGERIIPHGTCILIGSIEIEAFIHDFWYRSRESQVEKVEFYIDNELRATVEQTPFSWTWNEKVFGEHTIKIIAEDDEGHRFSCERIVKKIL